MVSTIFPSLLPLLALFAFLFTSLAAPVAPEPLHRLKLRKIPTIRDDEHPAMAFQRHHNQAIRKLHLCTNTTPPTNEFFAERTLRRRLLIEDDNQVDKRLWYPATTPVAHEANEKRLWYRPSSTEFTDDKRAVMRDLGPSPVDNIKEIIQALQDGGDGTQDEHGEDQHQQKSSSAEVVKGGSTASTAAPSVAVGLASDSENAANDKTIEVTASGSNANGFSNAALNALLDNTVTESTSNLIKGGLDYQIEANDVGYLAEVQIGTPPQSFLMLMDTGSGDTWVPSSACTASQCGNHLTLGTDVSSTFVADKTPFSVTYGSGAVAGNKCKDTMSIAGMSLANHAFGVTTQETAQFSGAKIPFDGLMGLSFNALSQQAVATPIDSLASSGQIKQAVLGIALGRIADGENDGELVFGQADTFKLDAATTQTLAVTSTAGFWQVAMSAVTVNGKDTSVGRQAILDTGTSLIVAPAADAQAFHAQIEGAASDGQGGFTIPCTTDAVVSMTFGNAAFQIDVRDLIFQPAGNSVTGQCLSSISAGTVTDDQTWLLGDAFLKNVYMTTNVQTRTVQLSARTDSPGSSSATKTPVAVAESNKQVIKVSSGQHGAKHGTRAGILGVGGIAAYLSRRND